MAYGIKSYVRHTEHGLHLFAITALEEAPGGSIDISYLLAMGGSGRSNRPVEGVRAGRRACSSCQAEGLIIFDYGTILTDLLCGVVLYFFVPSVLATVPASRRDAYYTLRYIYLQDDTRSVYFSVHLEPTGVTRKGENRRFYSFNFALFPTFFLRCLPSFISREWFDRHVPLSTMK